MKGETSMPAMQGERGAAACAELSPVAQFAVDRAGRLLYANARYQDLFGDNLWVDSVAPSAKENAQAVWQEALDGACDFEGEFQVDLSRKKHPPVASPKREVRSGGDRRTAPKTHSFKEISVHCWSVDENSPLFGVVLDASRSATRRTLVRTLIDALPDTVYAKDRNSKFLLNNIAHANSFRVKSPEDLVGKCDHDFYPKEIADKCLADETALMENGLPLVNYEEMGNDNSGNLVWLLTTKIPLKDSQGEVVGMVGISKDISELKKTQQALEETAHQLEAARDAALESSKAKSQFLANMSHEIRTPMNGVIGMTELLRTTPLTKEQEEFVRTIATCGESLMAVINDILDFSKIEAGQLSIEKIEFHPHTVIADVLKLYAPTAEAKGLELIGDISRSTERTCTGDPVRMRQILSNLVGNSIKFTDQGYVLVTAKLEDEDGQPRLHFTVKDTGIGIPADRIKPIFESFTQVDASTTRRFGGTGLGLAICKELVHLMHGSIAVESEVGSGSEFKVELALGKAEGSLHTRGGDIAGLRILVCDDLEINRRIIVAHLQRAGCFVEVAERGTEAIDRISNQALPPLDLLVLDYMMPVLNGFDVAKTVSALAIDNKPGILLLTSAGNSLNRSEMDKVGIDACLDKPVLRATLLETIASIKGPQTDIELETQAGPETDEAAPWLRVLLVEDNEVNERVAVLMLESLGCAVETVRDGMAALIKCGEGFDLILMDCQMPVMDGYEATAAIRARESETHIYTPIVAMTASALEGDRQRCLEAGMDDHISKPVTRAKLLEALERNCVKKAA